jgi:uncharacterized DUF497 family protein
MNRRLGTRSPAKRSASRGKVEAALRVVSPEAALDAPCPGYRPADDGEPVARLSAARAGGILYNSCFKNVKFFPTLRVLSLDNCLYFFVYTIRMNMMPMEFEWDANKAISNLRKHGIRFEEAVLVLDDPRHLSRQDRYENGEYRWQTIGLVHGVIVIMVAHSVRFESGTEVIRIISARKADSKERNRYEHG